ncbi:cytidine(C)-cytidine(C)-adenosine (A)]-adding enzyme [Brucella endophytica]|uniref:Cytidine(C)-cytidine(C)-adenosine (A)]-adding enzyme n=1 Tax=Brucella endophytica TaxID=1963359 RepID=A0A916WJ77_9HYPH|nr:CCA tRNA nucleotidyltransferase [Brucella endophytica]GGB05095.1 cytidine(C)-cytidine(C)-adenosine (A)]-adding enzyme [Brucella endophytica]
MNDTISISDRAPWLANKHLQALLAALCEGGEEARIVGGAVRNTLIGEKVGDIDIATTTLPDETARRATALGFKAVPTGIDHGTVTVVAAGKPYEVTTLRADVETDGRRAKVAFGRDWKADAERRDFTINALYARADGTVIDPAGGLKDIEARTLRFIGDAETRIREDYLRILRFFRFFAWYGSGRPETQGLKACNRLKDGLTGLSKERVWEEIKKLLLAPDPSRALLWMRQTGVLTLILPESEKWGIDAIHGLVRAEQDLGWPADPLLRLMSIVPPNAERMEALGARLKMSNAERARLEAWARAGTVGPEFSEQALKKIVYRGNKQAVRDRIQLVYAAARQEAIGSDKAMIRAGGFARLLEAVDGYEAPVFPVTGGDLLALGVKKGPRLGEMLRSLETIWIDSGFKLDREALLGKVNGNETNS